MTQSTSSVSAGTDSHLRLISLPGIAALAQVRRASVSNWRRRPKHGIEFPTARKRERGQEWFDSAEVVEWLEVTGRGNNPAIREDAAAFAGPGVASVPGGSDNFAALTALITVIALTDHPIDSLSVDELVDLADELDPDDEFLFSEIESLGSESVELADYATQLVDAAYNPADAFEGLAAQRFQRALQHETETALSELAVATVAAIAQTLAVQSELSAPVFVDPTGGSSDLLIALQGTQQGPDTPLAHIAFDGSTSSRMARRRLILHDIACTALVRDEDGGYLLPSQALAVGQFPSSIAPRMTTEELILAIESLLLQSDSSTRAVVVGPAAALVDRLDDSLARKARDAVIRSNRLRAVIRLPAGMIISKPRQALAVYCLGPDDGGARFESTRTGVADLSNVELTPAVVDELLTDISDAMSGFGRGHGPHFLLPVLSRELLARSNLVQVGRAPVRPDRSLPADLVIEWDLLRPRVADQIRAPKLPMLVPNDQTRRVTSSFVIADALAGKQLKMISGSRIDLDQVLPGGAVRVIGTQELERTGTSTRSVDRLDLALRYPNATMTEPGDVVFCSEGRPRALVDGVGGSLVQYPARILRCRSGHFNLVPELLAIDINRLPSRARTWRGWPIRPVPPDQCQALAKALAQLGQTRTQLHAKLDQLDELSLLLARAATSGALTLDFSEGPQ